MFRIMSYDKLCTDELANVDFKVKSKTETLITILLFNINFVISYQS
jgi:hypothetical protein